LKHDDKQAGQMKQMEHQKGTCESYQNAVGSPGADNDFWEKKKQELTNYLEQETLDKNFQNEVTEMLAKITEFQRTVEKFGQACESGDYLDSGSILEKRASLVKNVGNLRRKIKNMRVSPNLV
jgi:hypothetical protein